MGIYFLRTIFNAPSTRVSACSFWEISPCSHVSYCQRQTAMSIPVDPLGEHLWRDLSPYAVRALMSFYHETKSRGISDFCPVQHRGTLLTTKQIKTNSVALSPQANYTDWSTATCRRNLVPTVVDRGVSPGKRGGSPVVVNLSFLDRSR
jgi:hypothetical protein